MRSAALFVLASTVTAFTPKPSRTFATFGNDQTKALIRSWQPKPLNVPEGDCFLPGGAENMKKFVRARILLEDKSTGCVASMDGHSLCIILCRFSRAEHQMVLPLWQPSQSSMQTFQDLIKWHRDNFPDGARLSGAKLESPADKDVWNRVASDFSA